MFEPTKIAALEAIFYTEEKLDAYLYIDCTLPINMEGVAQLMKYKLSLDEKEKFYNLLEKPTGVPISDVILDYHTLQFTKTQYEGQRDMLIEGKLFKKGFPGDQIVCVTKDSIDYLLMNYISATLNHTSEDKELCEFRSKLYQGLALVLGQQYIGDLDFLYIDPLENWFNKKAVIYSLFKEDEPIEIDGETITMNHYKKIVLGKWTPSGYEYLPSAKEYPFEREA